MDEEQAIAARDPLEILPIADEPADFRLGLPGEQIATHAGRPEHSLELERIVPDRVAVRDDGVELVREAKPLAHNPSPARVRSAPFSGSKSFPRRSPAATSCSRRFGRSVTIAHASAAS